MNLQVEFKEETGQSAYDLVNLKYKEYYVEWLEEQIEQLRIGGVSQQSEPLHTKVFKLANELAINGYGNEAVKMHQICNGM